MKVILLFLRGLLMGLADLVPGVSGGTVALITGIYEQLIHSIAKIDIVALSKGGFKAFFRSIAFSFFLPLGAGILSAILLFSSVLAFLLEGYPDYTFAFFSGLILASAVLLWKDLEKISVELLMLVAVGFIFGFVVSGITSMTVSHSLLVVYLAGVIAISAMLLPGISGSFLLLVFNQYEYIIMALHQRNIVVLFVFGCGCLTGLLGFSRVLQILMRRYKYGLMAVLIGVMLGALRVPFEHIQEFSWVVWVIIGLGFGLVLVISNVAKRHTI